MSFPKDAVAATTHPDPAGPLALFARGAERFGAQGRALLGNTVLALLAHPAVLGRDVREPGLLSGVIDEVLTSCAQSRAVAGAVRPGPPSTGASRRPLLRERGPHGSNRSAPCQCS